MALERTQMGASAFPGGDPSTDQRRSGSLQRWLRAFLTALLYAVVGMMLAALPWLPDWDQNYFSGNSRQWYSIWMNPCFRGAISAAGVVNLCVSFLELLELRWGAKE